MSLTRSVWIQLPKDGKCGICCPGAGADKEKTFAELHKHCKDILRNESSGGLTERAECHKVLMEYLEAGIPQLKDNEGTGELPTAAIFNEPQLKCAGRRFSS